MDRSDNVVPLNSKKSQRNGEAALLFAVRTNRPRDKSFFQTFDLYARTARDLSASRPISARDKERRNAFLDNVRRSSSSAIIINARGMRRSCHIAHRGWIIYPETRAAHNSLKPAASALVSWPKPTQAKRWGRFSTVVLNRGGGQYISRRGEHLRVLQHGKFDR